MDTHCAASSPKPIQLECWTTTNFLSSRVTTRVRQEEINHGCSGDLQFFQHNMSRIWDCVFFSFTIFEVIVTVQRVWRRSQFSIFCIAAEPIKKRGLYLSDSGAYFNLIDSFYCVNILAVHSRAAIVPNWPFYDPVHMPRDQKPTPAIVECTGIVKIESSLSHHILKINYH